MEQEYQQMANKGLHSYPIHLLCRKEIDLGTQRINVLKHFSYLTHLFHILLAQIVAMSHGHITILLSLLPDCPKTAL